MPQYQQVRATNLSGLDDMTRSYLECAEWAGFDSDEQDALELAVSPTWDAKSIAQAVEDCAAFQRDHAGDLLCGSPELAGHDFFLTRNGHGAGFWDGDWPTEVGERLRVAARAYGGAYVSFDADSETLYLS